jgi:hypothetical protein
MIPVQAFRAARVPNEALLGPAVDGALRARDFGA